jgi:arsenite transporter
MTSKIEKILYATDFSIHSRLSIEWAMTLAQTHQARLLALNVVDDVVFLAPGIQMYFTQEEWEKLKQRNEEQAIGLAKERLHSFCEEARTPECVYVPVEILARRGKPVEEIVAAAKEHQCDLIVMSTTGGGGLTDAIMGSTARGVLRRSPIPVLAVPTTEKQD